MAHDTFMHACTIMLIKVFFPMCCLDCRPWPGHLPDVEQTHKGGVSQEESYQSISWGERRRHAELHGPRAPGEYTYSLHWEVWHLQLCNCGLGHPHRGRAICKWVGMPKHAHVQITRRILSTNNWPVRHCFKMIAACMQTAKVSVFSMSRCQEWRPNEPVCPKRWPTCRGPYSGRHAGRDNSAHEELLGSQSAATANI